MAPNILVTGGAGYIGSHTVLQLLSGGFRVVVVDNLDNASEAAIHRVKELAGEFGCNLSFHKVCLLPRHSVIRIIFHGRLRAAKFGQKKWRRINFCEGFTLPKSGAFSSLVGYFVLALRCVWPSESCVLSFWTFSRAYGECEYAAKCFFFPFGWISRTFDQTHYILLLWFSFHDLCSFFFFGVLILYFSAYFVFYNRAVYNGHHVFIIFTVNAAFSCSWTSVTDYLWRSCFHPRSTMFLA